MENTDPHTKTKCYLDIWDHAYPADTVANIITTGYLYSWKKGDKIGNTIRERDLNGCRYRFSDDANLTVNEHLQILLDAVHPILSLSDIVNKVEIWIVCVLYVYDGDRPDLVIEKHNIMRAAQIGAGLDIDLYNF